MASQKTSGNHAFGKQIRQETCINGIKYFSLTDSPSYLSAKLKFVKFDLCKSVHYHTIQINQPTRCNSFTSLLFEVYVWLYMFRALLRQSSGAYNCTRSLWFYRWSVVVGALLVVVWQTTSNNALTVKPEAPGAVVRSWWWAGRRPKHVEPHINVK